MIRNLKSTQIFHQKYQKYKFPLESEPLLEVRSSDGEGQCYEIEHCKRQGNIMLKNKPI